jgi:polysaccharide biosynthesis transport protein
MSHIHDDKPIVPAQDAERKLVVAPGLAVPMVRPRNGARTAKEPSGISLVFILNALRQWWKVAVPAGVALAAIAGLIVFMQFKPTYSAAAWLQIQDIPPFVAFEPQDRENRSKRFVQTQVELIRSPMILQPILGQPGIADIPELQDQNDPVSWLSRKIKVMPVGDSELYMATFECANPTGSAWFINAVLDQYFKLRNQDDIERTNRVIRLLQQEKTRRAEEIGQLRENVRILTKQATGKDPFAANPESNFPRNHPFSGLQEQLILTQVDNKVVAARLKALEETPRQRLQVPQALIDKNVEANVEVQKWKTAVIAKRAQLHENEVLAAKGKKDSSSLMLAREIERDEQTLGELRSELRKQIAAEMEAAQQSGRDTELAELKSQLSNLQIKEEMLRQRQESEIKELEVGSGETLQLQFKRSELAQAQEVMDRISTRITQLSTEQQAPARVTLWQRATVPSQPIDANPYSKILFASLAGLALPFALAVFWEKIVRRISSPDQLEQESHLAVVGEIASLPIRIPLSKRASTRGIAWDMHVYEESIDSLRTTLTLSEDLSEMRVLAVTSAVKHEGKTSVAVQLAVSLARATEKLTLLIDGDMRSPDVHRQFGIPLTPGLAEVLSGECTLEEAIVTSWGNNVHLLPAGKLSSSPHKLLGNGAREWLRNSLPDQYRYVIIDTPPVLAASEALVLAKAADACLLCTLRDVSRAGQVKRAFERLTAAGSHPVGAVLSGLPTRAYAHRYGSYSYGQEKF